MRKKLYESQRGAKNLIGETKLSKQEEVQKLKIKIEKAFKEIQKNLQQKITEIKSQSIHQFIKKR